MKHIKQCQLKWLKSS